MPLFTPHFFPYQGNKYTYWTAGDIQKPPLMILYGYTGNHEDFEDMVKHLLNNYFIIIPDFPGWQLPQPTFRMTIHNYARYFKALNDYLGYSQITLLGHCMGAVVAIELASLYPQTVKGLLLVSVPYLEGTLPHKMFQLFAHGAHAVPRWMRALFFIWRNRIVNLPIDFIVVKVKSWPRKLKKIHAQMIRQSSEREDAVEEEWLSFLQFDFTKVKALTIPIHLIHGKKDMFITLSQAKKFRAFVPEATFDTIPHAGHVPPYETPQSLATLIKKYCA